MVRLQATTEKIPADSSGATEPEYGELIVDAPSYEQAREELDEQLADGWRLVSILRTS